jgi:hypothetical protein
MMKHAKTRVVLAAIVIGVVSGFSRTNVRAQTPIKLYVFDGGVLDSDPTRYRLTKEDGGTTQVSVAADLSQNSPMTLSRPATSTGGSASMAV